MPRFDKLLILDIDETLLYSSETALEFAADHRIGTYHTYKRPGLDEFLDTISTWFRLAIWTSATEDYAQAVIQQVLPHNIDLLFVFSRTQCVRKMLHTPDGIEPKYIKPLDKVKKFGYAPQKMLVLEDDPIAFSRNYGNAIRIAQYRGERADDELQLLLRYLEVIGPIADVRQIEKRDWRLQVQELP